MQIEYVAWKGFTSWRTPQQQRHLAIGDSLLGKIVIDQQGMHAIVAEPLAHRAAAERRQELERRGIGGRRCDDGRVFHRAGVSECFYDLGDRRTFLTDGNVDAVELLLLVARIVD